MPRRIESLFIDGPAGKLEALLEEPEGQAPTQAALVCHPHPQHGGTMHNKVVYRIARGMRRAGAAVLRFNYRGVNMSEGKYDNEVGEAEDARTALAFLRSRYTAVAFFARGIFLRFAHHSEDRLPDTGIFPPDRCGFSSGFRGKSAVGPMQRSPRFHPQHQG